MAGILMIVISKSNTSASGFLKESFHAPILIISMLLLGASLFIKLYRERKKKDFSILTHTREIIRTLGGLGLAVYYLLQGSVV